MSRKALTRDHGIRLGRLPGYTVKSNFELENLPGAQALRTEMLKLVTAKAVIRVNGGKASYKTIEKSREVLGEMCLRLWRLGFQVKVPSSLNGKHFEAVVRDHWACGSSQKHIAAAMTELNKLDDWLCKPGLTKSKMFYLPEVDPNEFQVSMIARHSKSWSENGIDINQKMAEADRKDKRFGLMLRLCLALGLRRCEVLQIKPWLDDRQTFFDIRPGIAKGGRARTIPYLHPAQLQVVEYVKSQVKRDEFLGWPSEVKGSNVMVTGLLLRNEKRYSKYMAAIGISRSESGVTGHGLRAEFAEDMSLLMGLIPATRGGTKGQMSKSDEDTIRIQISENMGHSRRSVTGAYYGNLKHKLKNNRGERLGSIGLNGGMQASIYMNPPPRLNDKNEYVRIQKRSLENTAIVVVVESLQDGLFLEIGQFSFKESAELITVALAGLSKTENIDARNQAIELLRLGNILLAKFGVMMLTL